MMTRHRCHRKKWAAFYALETLVRRRYAERPRLLAHAALLVTAALLATVCGLNDTPLAAVPQFQALAQSLFCVIVGALYAIYMLITFLARAVMHFAGERRARYMPPSDDEEEALALGDNHNTEAEEAHGEEEEEEEDDFDVLRHQSTMTREQVVASMYLGGVGAFLALGPLCMWNCALTLAFLVSLLGVALAVESSVHMGTTAWILMGASALTLGCAIGIECTRPVAAFHHFNHNTNLTTRLALLLAPTTTHAWPAWLILSAASPPLLYAGLGGASSSAALMMTPSKTLETGLPMSLLLACVLLGWFNPIEAALWADHGAQALQQPRMLLLLIAAPLLLVSVLAFLMHALRSRSVLPALALLTAVMAVRQQATRASSPRAIDAAALTFAVVAVIAAIGRLRASFAFPVARRT
jgi:hypothetical protein